MAELCVVFLALYRHSSSKRSSKTWNPRKSERRSACIAGWWVGDIRVRRRVFVGALNAGRRTTRLRFSILASGGSGSLAVSVSPSDRPACSSGVCSLVPTNRRAKISLMTFWWIFSVNSRRLTFQPRHGLGPRQFDGPPGWVQFYFGKTRLAKSDCEQ